MYSYRCTADRKKLKIFLKSVKTEKFQCSFSFFFYNSCRKESFFKKYNTRLTCNFWVILIILYYGRSITICGDFANEWRRKEVERMKLNGYIEILLSLIVTSLTYGFAHLIFVADIFGLGITLPVYTVLAIAFLFGLITYLYFSMAAAK